MRRFWMLLLVVMVLAAFLAVPAMATTEEGHLHGTCADGSACTACGQDHTGWTDLSTIDSITESGNYFVDTAEGVALEKSFEISTAGLEVTICLNGREWTGVTNTETPANTTRPLTVNSASTVNIVDCSDQTDGVSAGRIVGVDVTSRGTPNGGTLYVSAGAEVNMYNGTVVGGRATKGGGLYITGDKTEVNFVGGVIEDGTAVSNGGNLYLNSGKFNMGTEGNTSVTSPAISGGSNTTAKQNGGSVYANAGTFKLMSGIVSGGTAANAGSNIHVASSATLHMTGGKVCEPGRNGSNQNVFVVNGTVNMSGGEIVGYFSCTNSTAVNKTSVNISGSAKITGTGMWLGIVSPATMAPKIQVTAPLNEDAHITIASKGADTETSENILIAATANDWQTYEAYIRGADPQITTTAANTVLTYEQDGIRLRSTADSQIWHCVCGANADEAHIGDCDGYDVEWEPWELTGSSSLPMGSSGHWYLVDADGEDDQQVEATLVNVNNPTDAKEVYIDFNGVKVTRNSDLRFGYIYSADAEKRHMHVFTDSSQDHTGGLIVDIQTGTSDHSNFWVRDNSTLICYRLNADFSTTSVKEGSGFRAATATSELKLYECHVIGGTAALTSGSAISNGGTTTIVGGTITGGTATTVGGAIYNSGSLEMTDVEITGGTAGTRGGAIYNTGTLTVSDSTITGGTANGAGDDDGGGTIYNTGTLTFTNVDVTGGTTAKNGGAIYNSAGLTVTSGSITGGSATVSGGAIYTKGGMLLTTNCQIKGGTAGSNGGAVIITGGTATLDNTDITAETEGTAASKGAALYVHAGTMTVKGGSVITGGTASGYGGAVYMAGGTFNLKGSTVTGGTAIYGGAVYMTGTSTSFNMSENAYVTYGTAKGASTDTWSPGGNFYVNQGTLNVENSTISNGQDTEAGLLQTNVEGNNLYINFSGTVNLNNGAKIINSANNSEASIHMQGGVLNIHAGSEITNNENVVCRNIFMNAEALCRANSAKTAFTFEYVDYAPVINMDGGVISGGRYTSHGANIYMNHKGQLNMTGGEIRDGVINGTNTGGSGANIYVPALSNNTTVNGVKGVLTAYQASSQDRADTTIADLAAKVTIEGTAKVIGGVTKNYTTTAGEVKKPNGGSISMGDNTTLTIGGTAEIYGGTTGNGGGNIYSNGYVTIKEQAKIYNGWSSSRDWDNAFLVNADVELLGGEIWGGVSINGQNAGSLKLSGAPVVDPALCTLSQKPTKGLNITYNEAADGNSLPTSTLTSFTIEGLTKDANVVLSASQSASNVVLATSVDEASVLDGLHYLTSDYYIQKNGQSQLVLLTKADVTGVTVNGGDVVYDLADAVAKLGENDYITLVNSIENATISKSVQLDLDGNSLINLTLAEGVELKLFDASTGDYTVEEDPESSNGYSGYGIVTRSSDSKGVILRQANTPKDTYGHNYRYVVLMDEEGYHAHRIYLAVKSTILYPNKAAVNYRTALRCDQLVAKYINAEGGGFGILASADSASYSDYTENRISASSWDGENENDLITRLSGLLDEDNDITVNVTNATTNVKAQAYIYLADQFTGKKLVDGNKDANAELIASEGLTSSGVNQSLQGMVQIAFSKDPATLDTMTKEALYHMYTKWSTGLMENWSLRYLAEYESAYGGVDMKYACLCGHPESTDNPCADNGHAQITWKPWDGSEGKFPSESGNYYLTDNLVLTEQGSVSKDDFINLNTNGFAISTGTGKNGSTQMRVANVYGVLNLTNFGVDGQEVEESTVTATCMEAGNGGVLLILNHATDGKGNVSLYSGVTLTGQEGHNICYGVVEVGGDLNVYGGNIRGVTLNNSRLIEGEETDITSTGGAVGVTADGYFYMNSGSITGGKAARGGAIHNKGKVELEGGTITGGTADDGGMIYVAGGTLLNNGVDLDASGCQAKRGGLMYLADGQVAMAGTADDKLTLTGGTVYTTFKTKQDGGNTVKDGDNSYDKHGSGGVFFVAGGTLDLDYCTVTGGATKQMNLAGTSIGNYIDDLDGHGGSVMYIAGGEVTIDACQLNGYSNGMANKRGGNIYMVGGTVTVDGDEKVTGSSTLTAGWSGVNGAVLYQTGGSFTINEGTTLTSAEIFASNGNLKNGVTYGGTVSLASGSSPVFNMHGGTITGGKIKANVTSNHGGGNVSVTSGTFNMYGGEITNGVSLATAVNENLTGGGNVRVGGGTFNMTGGSITGGEAKNGLGGGILLSGGTLNISGTARITGNTHGTDANNVYLSSGKTISLGKLETGAEIGVTMADLGGYVTEGNTENTKQALDNRWLYSDKGLDMDIESGSDQDFYIGKYGCICGATGTEAHIGQCDETAVMWTPWMDETHLPDQAGYWYLAYEGEVTVTEQASIGYNSTTNVNVVVDLNGKTVRRDNTGDNNRFFAIRTSAAVNTLTITDSSVGHTGKLVCVDEGSGQGLGVWGQADNGILNIYRGTIDASESTAVNNLGNAICLNGGQVNMYGGKLIGGTNHKGGGAVFMATGTSFNMVDGQIIAGEALCTLTTNGTETKQSGGITYTYNKYKCSSHGEGGAVYIDSGATFDMSGGTVTIPTLTEEELATYRGAGHGGLFYVLGTLNLSGDASLSGGRANGAGNALGVVTVGRSDCGYGGNIYISGKTVSGSFVPGVVNVTGSDVTISDGFATAGLLEDATYTDATTGDVKTLTGLGSAGGGLGGNICVSGTLNMTAGTLEGGEASTGGNLGTNNANGRIYLGVPAEEEGTVNEKTVQILDGTADSGGNIAINVRPCAEVVINRGTWIEGGHATSNGGNIAVTPWLLDTAQYVETGTDEDGKTLYEKDYDSLVTVNGGTITGGISGNLGGNIFLYGRAYTKDKDKDTAYDEVYIHAKIILGEDAVVSNGAAQSNGNNLYVNSYGDAVLSGTVRNTLPQGPWPSEGTAEYTVSKNSIYVGTITSHLTMEATGSIVNEKAEGAAEVPHIRNLYVNSGLFTMNGGTISGGYLVEKGDSGANVVVNTGTNKATFIMNGGEIKDGVYGYTSTSISGYDAYNGGGNVYVRGIFQMHGGVISGGKCLAVEAKDANSKDVVASAHGGNVLVSEGELTMDGNAQIKDGKVAYSGGNVYIANAGTLTMDSANASITGGMSTWYNGGNVFVNGGCTFELKNGTVSDGVTRDGGGNVYSNGTIKISGGKLEAGLAAATWADHTDYASERTYANANATNSNVFMVNSHLYMSGGEVDTGMASTRTSNTERTIKFSGDAKVLGTGITLGSTANGSSYYNLDTVDGTELNGNGQVYITASKLGNFGDYIRLNVALDDVAYGSQLFKEAAPETCQVVYMTAANAPDGVGGIYLYNGAKYRFHCLCGVNDSELATKGHLPGCNRTELVWRAWTSASLPTEPGNWFLYYTSLSNGTDGGETVKYKAVDTGALKYDYYKDSEGNWHAVRALLAVDESGNFTTMDDKSFKQATDASGDPIWLTSDGNAVADLGNYQVVDSYTINVDLNGYKLEGPTGNRNLTFYGRSEYNDTLYKKDAESGKTVVDEENTAVRNEFIDSLEAFGAVYTDSTEARHYSTHRQGKVTYTIMDASQGHTAVMATAGRYSGKVRTAYSQPQGTNIWMYWQEDTLNTYRTTIDASSSIHGWGMALTVEGTANLYDTKLIGGIAQGYYSSTETVTDSSGTDHEVNTLSGSTVGGGALYISETGVVNMYGGEIKNGMSIYRYMDGTNGADADRAVGGGNVFTNGEFNVKGTSTYPASITGGKALYYAEADGEKNSISTYATKQGGGVYLNDGTMTVEGNVTITGNTIGTVSAATEGSVPGTVVPTSITGETVNNLFLNGNTVTVKSLTGNVGFTMNGTNWEGVFAEVDTGDTAYVNTHLIPDVAQTNAVMYADGLLRYAAQVDTLQVGYGAASIYPTVNDIRNGLLLGGYGNNSYSSSGELMRMTRYWKNTETESSMPATVYNRTLSTDDSFIDMKATAMAFRDTEGDTVIVINLDYNNVAQDVGNNLKRIISHATGVPIDNITISASHQHTGPAVNKTYWQDLEGNYTKARDLTNVTEGTYEKLIYGNEPLEAWEEREVRTNYAETFYTGVRDAAVEAYNDLKDVVSISGGIMDTTTGGNQFNFVRNVALYDASDLNTVKGMVTDNHTTHVNIDGVYYSTTNGTQVGVSDGRQISASQYVQLPESELDVTMQLVKYERADKTIVLANFQSHPHLADGSDNLNPNGGVVEIFRQNLSAAYGTAEKPCQVLYFSGAGGNVNSTAKISSDNNLQPWYVLENGGYTNKATGTTNAEKRAIQAQYHGQGLAALANTFIRNANGQLSVTVDPTKANVQVKVVDFEYGVWDEKQAYTVSGVTVPATWSDTKLANAKLLVDWEKGGYLDRPGNFNTSTKRDGSSIAYWYEFTGNPTSANDKIYSFFHANGVRKRLVRKEAENMRGTFEIKTYDLGGIGFVAAPYEMFQESGQAIKGNVQSTLKASQPEKYASFPDYVTNGCGYIASEDEDVKTSPYGITIIASQTTGAQGYIPSVIGYKNGGYATDTTLFEPGTGEQLVTAYVDMLHAMNATYTATTAEGE